MVPLFLPFQYFPEEIPFAPGRLAFPAPPVELIAGIDAKTALGTAVSVPRHIRGDPFEVFAGELAGRRLAAVPEESCYRLKRARGADRRADDVPGNYFPGVHEPLRIDALFIADELFEPLLAEDGLSLSCEIETCGIRPSAVFFGYAGNRKREAEDEMIIELALIGGNKTENDDLRFTARFIPDDDHLFDDRLGDLLFYFIERGGERGDRKNELRRYKTRSQSLYFHDPETVVPFV